MALFGRLGMRRGTLAVILVWFAAMAALFCLDKTFKEDFNQISLLEMELHGDHDHSHDNHEHDHDHHHHSETTHQHSESDAHNATLHHTEEPDDHDVMKRHTEHNEDMDQQTDESETRVNEAQQIHESEDHSDHHSHDLDQPELNEDHDHNDHSVTEHEDHEDNVQPDDPNSDRLYVNNLYNKTDHYPDQKPSLSLTTDLKNATTDELIYRQPADSKVIHVCMTSDNNTLPGMIASINSIVRNTKHQVAFHLVTDTYNVNHLRAWIENSPLRTINYSITAFNIEKLAGKITVRGGRPELAKAMNYARYFYPDLFPNLGGKLIHIDDDCIVQGDISELYSATFAPGHIVSVSDDCNSVAKSFMFKQNLYSSYINFNHSTVKSLIMNPQTCAFNTGVYVLDLDLWRRSNITQTLEQWLMLNTREFVYGHARGSGGSQPPLLLALYNRFSTFDPLWHVRQLGWEEGLQYPDTFIQTAKLLHWNGRMKPWAISAPHYKVWDQYFIPDPTKMYQHIR